MRNAQMSSSGASEVACVKLQHIAFFRMRAPQRLNTVFVQAGVKLALIYSKSRRAPDQGCPKDSPAKSREQERPDTSEENSGPWPHCAATHTAWRSLTPPAAVSSRGP